MASGSKRGRYPAVHYRRVLAIVLRCTRILASTRPGLFGAGTQLGFEIRYLLQGKAPLGHLVRIIVADVNLQIPADGYDAADRRPFVKRFIEFGALNESVLGYLKSMLPNHATLLEQEGRGQPNDGLK